jgi:hypothetical protein
METPHVALRVAIDGIPDRADSVPYALALGVTILGKERSSPFA